MKTIIVTGGSGYIGGHIIKKLLSNGYFVVSIDKSSPLEIKNESFVAYQFDITNSSKLESVFSKYQHIDCVIHCAGELGIEKSYKNPSLYYTQNVYATECILNAMINHKVNKIIYSSSASVYPNMLAPVDEKTEVLVEAMSPYSYTKYLSECKLKSLSQVLGIDYVAFRYFNVVGCDCDTDQSSKTYFYKHNIVPQLIKSVNCDIDIPINGNHFETEDGTCVRDYIEIEDLTQLHLNAVDRLCSPNWSAVLNGVYNAGSGIGISVDTLIRLCENAVSKKIRRRYAPRRKGDTPYLCANIDKTKKAFSWEPKNDLILMFKHLFKSYKDHLASK